MKPAHEKDKVVSSNKPPGQEADNASAIDDEGFIPVQRQAARHLNNPSSSTEVVRT